jgi:hypothetical protein
MIRIYGIFSFSVDKVYQSSLGKNILCRDRKKRRKKKKLVGTPFSVLFLSFSRDSNSAREKSRVITAEF